LKGITLFRMDETVAGSNPEEELNQFEKEFSLIEVAMEKLDGGDITGYERVIETLEPVFHDQN